jgi:hypothetical protein
MKIISGWKDYYDHVAHQYGGGDPKVIYNRDYIVPDERSSDGMAFEQQKELYRQYAPAIPRSMTLIHAGVSETQRHEFRALIVLNRVFILERYGDVDSVGSGIARVRKDWHITSRTILDMPYHGLAPLIRSGEDFTDEWNQYSRKRMQEWVETEHRYMKLEQGYRWERGLKLCEFVGAPVFVVDGVTNPVAMGRTPKLAALGVPAFIGATQLYQELAMFVGNVLNPVEQPASPMKDIEKVVSHGFDKKVSFRHRK